MSQSTDMLAEPPETSLAERAPRVVILGGGFAGLHAARQLAGGPVEVVIVDKENHHLFQPLLYQVATAGLNPADIAMPIRSVFSGRDNVRVRLAEAQSIDREARQVELDTGTLWYDYLVVATGTKPKYFGPEAWEANSTPLKTIEDALELRREILYAFERAEQTEDPEEVKAWLTFVVVGGGPTGVEMAGAIREIAAEVMIQDFRTIRPEEARVVLVDAQSHILGSYPEELSEHARRELESREVQVRVDAPVEEIGTDYVVAGGERWRAHTIVWAAGVEPVSLVGSLGAETVDDGRVKVADDLRIPDDDRVFVVGDITYLEQDGQPLPGLAPVAIQQGKAAARNIERIVEGGETEAFTYRDRGQMSTIGRKSAVGVVGGWKLRGFFAWLAWLFIHLLFLVGFRNKIAVLFSWAYSYIAFRRGARLIVGEPRTRLAEPVQKSLETDGAQVDQADQPSDQDDEQAAE